MTQELGRLKFQQQDTLRSLLKGAVSELEGTKAKTTTSTNVSASTTSVTSKTTSTGMGVGTSTSTSASNKTPKGTGSASASTTSMSATEPTVPNTTNPSPSPSHTPYTAPTEDSSHTHTHSSPLPSSPIPADDGLAVGDGLGDGHGVHTTGVYGVSMVSTPIHTIHTSNTKSPAHTHTHTPVQPVKIIIDTPVNIVNPTTESTPTALHMKIPGSERTLQYVLHGLATTATKEHRREVYQLLKQLARMGEGDYWKRCGHQVLEGLLGTLITIHHISSCITYHTPYTIRQTPYIIHRCREGDAAILCGEHPGGRGIHSVSAAAPVQAPRPPHTAY